MKNSQLRRILMLASCAVLLVCLSVGATLAFLTSQTGVVTNTFVVGEGIEIELDEANVYDPGKEPSAAMFSQKVTDGDPAVEGEEAKRQTTNEYRLIPNWTYDKDPTVHVTKNSDNCWVFVKVTNGISAYEVVDDPGTEPDESLNTIAKQIAANGWVALDDEKNPGVYYYKDIIETTGVVTDLVVFSTFTTRNYENLSPAEIVVLNDAEVTIDAYAIQADGFGTAAAAWAANEHHFGD